MYSSRKKNNCLPAFTVMEVIVSMVIMSVIIGLIFTIFSYLSQRLNDFQRLNLEKSDISRFCYSINKDIFESEAFNQTVNGLEFMSYSGTRCNYFIGEKNIVRSNRFFTDTFEISKSRITIERIKNKSGRLQFKQIAISFTLAGENYRLRFYRPCYPNELLNESKP